MSMLDINFPVAVVAILLIAILLVSGCATTGGSGNEELVTPENLEMALAIARASYEIFVELAEQSGRMNETEIQRGIVKRREQVELFEAALAAIVALNNVSEVTK